MPGGRNNPGSKTGLTSSNALVASGHSFLVFLSLAPKEPRQAWEEEPGARKAGNLAGQGTSSNRVWVLLRALPWTCCVGLTLFGQSGGSHGGQHTCSPVSGTASLIAAAWEALQHSDRSGNN